VNECEWHGIA